MSASTTSPIPSRCPREPTTSSWSNPTGRSWSNTPASTHAKPRTRYSARWRFRLRAPETGQDLFDHPVSALSRHVDHEVRQRPEPFGAPGAETGELVE